MNYGIGIGHVGLDYFLYKIRNILKCIYKGWNTLILFYLFFVDKKMFV